MGLGDTSLKDIYREIPKTVGGMPADDYYAIHDAHVAAQQAEKDRQWEQHQARVEAQQAEKDREWAAHQARVAAQTEEKHRLYAMHDDSRRAREALIINEPNDVDKYIIRENPPTRELDF